MCICQSWFLRLSSRLSGIVETFLYQNVGRRRKWGKRKDLNKACWKEWNAVCSLSRAVWSWMSLRCNSCLKWPFVHLFRHRSLQTGSNIYAYLTSGVSLVSTQRPLGYLGCFLKSRGYFSVLPWYYKGLGGDPEPLAGNPMFCRQRSFSSFIKNSILFLYNL